MRCAATMLLAVFFMGFVADGQTLRPGERTILVLGDVNLGRQVGQEILRGDTLYPFRYLLEDLQAPDLVCINLESPLTDQGGETRHPTDGYRFCGPRMAARGLADAGVDVAVTANNHAYDYGRRGMLETISALEQAGIEVVGTRAGRTGDFDPVIVDLGGVRIGFLAYTEFVNMAGRWQGNISVFDRKRAQREIRRLRERADVVLVHYHGGAEYTERPPAGTLRNLRSLAAAGADVVIGHHPHVPQGVERVGSALVLYSLGNAVFYQPQLSWTRIGLAACIHVGPPGSGDGIGLVHLIPVAAGLQPALGLKAAQYDSVRARFTLTSPVPFRGEGPTFLTRLYDDSTF